jgi:DNA polymerase III subunit alpha
MVKIVSRSSLGIQPVYDIGVAKDHNFILENGLIASNCFNKSHSTAYAYVTYQTAYLKANYPVEYMAALLTASSDTQEKVERYRENCQKMGIKVEPPDINRSHKDFAPVGDRILFGFSAVRNLGEGAIDNILKAREEGEFSSLADFCSRVDLRVANRRALETLILSGAFDRTESNRNQLIHDLDLVIAWCQKRAKEKETGQTNLFDLVGGSSSASSPATKSSEFAQVPSAPAVPHFSLQEKLKLEKEHLGFYVSEHPLKSVQKSAQLLSPINLSDLENQKSRKAVSAVVIVVAFRKIMTKKGTPMAFVTLEDVSGQADGVVFPDSYESLQPDLVEGNHLILWGKTDKRDDKVQLIIEAVEPIEQVKMVMINLNPQQAISPSSQSNLKSILQEQSGDKSSAKVPVVAIVGQGNQRQFIRLGQNYWVQNDHNTVQSLHQAGFDAYSQPLVTQV